MSKPLPTLLRFWALRSDDNAFRVELQYPDGSVEQTVVTFRHNPHPVCNDVELSDADAEAVFFAEDHRFAGWDADTEAAWFECNRAFVRRMAELEHRPDAIAEVFEATREAVRCEVHQMEVGL